MGRVKNYAAALDGLQGHTAIRTSPKGKAFKGTCTRCGKKNLTTSTVNTPCPGHRLCPGCGQPMLPPGAKKRPNEYDHAQGCSGSKNTTTS